MAAALHILCKRESETPSVFVEALAGRHAAKCFRFTGGTAASNTDTFVLKSDDAHIICGASLRHAKAIARTSGGTVDAKELEDKAGQALRKLLR